MTPGLEAARARQRALLGDRADPHDRGPVDLLRSRGLGDRDLLADQCSRTSYFCEGDRNPLRTPAGKTRSARVVGRDQILSNESRNLPKVL